MPDEPDDLLFGRMQVTHAAALGRAIATWANFEFEVDEVTWALARLEPEQGACLTAQYSTVAQRFDALLSLAAFEKVGQKHIDKLNEIRNKALAIANKRNRIAHDPWFYGHESQKHYRLNKTAKGKLDFAYKAVTEEELKAIETEFIDITARFHNVKHAMLQEFYASPETPA
jgi:hypothetical protein